MNMILFFSIVISVVFAVLLGLIIVVMNKHLDLKRAIEYQKKLYESIDRRIDKLVDSNTERAIKLYDQISLIDIKYSLLLNTETKIIDKALEDMDLPECMNMLEKEVFAAKMYVNGTLDKYKEE